MQAKPDDWRLRGQDQYLAGAVLFWQRYTPFSKKWDHDHCAFCFRRFSTLDNDLHEGYATAGNVYWICEECYEDFKEMFKWTRSETPPNAPHN